MGENKVSELQHAIDERLDGELDPMMIHLLFTELDKYKGEYTKSHTKGTNDHFRVGNFKCYYEAPRAALFMVTDTPGGHPKIRIGRCDALLRFDQLAESNTHFGIIYSDDAYIVGFAIPDDPNGKIVSRKYEHKSKT